MSAFSECLSAIKIKRDLSSADVARICGVDTSVIFRWMKGERLPQDINKVKEMGRKLKLNVQERNQLEDSYFISVHGTEEYHSFIAVNRAIANLKNRVGAKQKTELPLEKKLILEELYHDIEPDIQLGFKELNSKNEIVGTLEKYLLQMNVNKEYELYINTNAACPEMESAIRQFSFLTEKCEIEQIIHMDSNDLYTGKDSSNNLLEKIISSLFQENILNIWICEGANKDNMNYVISKSFVLQYNDSMTKGMISTYSEIIDMYFEIYKECRETSIYVGRRELDTMLYLSDVYSNVSYLNVVENQPCMGAFITEEMLEKNIYKDLESREELIQLILNGYGKSLEKNNGIVENTETFFRESGLREFLENGYFEVFPYPVYHAFSLEERCDILRRCAEMIGTGRHVQRMLKEDELADFKDIHVEYQRGKEKTYVSVELEIGNAKKGRIYFFYDKIVDQFKDFFVVLKSEKYSYTPEETIKIILDTVEEYEKKQ